MEVPDLLDGAADLHVHSSPDLLPRLMSDGEVVDEARRHGYRAVVLKNHYEQTASRAQLVKDRAGESLDVFGGIVMNPQACGGINPYAVETALLLGARVVWFPTFGACAFQSHVHAALPAPIPPEASVSLTDPDCDWDAINDVIALVRDHDATLATGHLGPEEIHLVVAAARDVGVRRIIVTHPEMPFVALSVSEQRDLAAGGGVWFERVAVSTLGHFAVPVAQIAQAVVEVGVENTVLSSDLGQPGNPSPAVGLRAFGEALIDVGLAARDVRRALSDNPMAAIGLR